MRRMAGCCVDTRTEEVWECGRKVWEGSRPYVTVQILHPTEDKYKLASDHDVIPIQLRKFCSPRGGSEGLYGARSGAVPRAGEGGDEYLGLRQGWKWGVRGWDEDQD